MITSLLFTSTGNIILALIALGILAWCVWCAVVTVRQRKVLIELVKKDRNPLWPNMMEKLEDKSIFKAHIRRNVFLRSWKQLYRPYFYMRMDGHRFVESNEP